MPELPEVETTRRGVAPHILQQKVSKVIVREKKLRWPVPATLPKLLTGKTVQAVERRAKYLLLDVGDGTVMIHLGMSGSLRIVDPSEAVRKHDHVDIVFENGKALRFHDPRKFGCILWISGERDAHPLLARLGPEPLSEDFNAELLFSRSRKRKAPVKTFIMDGHIVVGVGNIYANEALFRAGIRPTREAGSISLKKYELLVAAIKGVLAEAITVGGTTLRDFIGGDGKPGYFKQSLSVYGRGGEPCVTCGSTLQEVRLGQRATVYCAKCQR